MARRTTLRAWSTETADEVLAGLALGMTIEGAAVAAGISEDTLKRWREGKSGADAEFAERFNRAMPKRERRWLKGLNELAQSDDLHVRLKATTELLDRCAPDYRKTERHEFAGKDGGPIAITGIAVPLPVAEDEP